MERRKRSDQRGTINEERWRDRRKREKRKQRERKEKDRCGGKRGKIRLREYLSKERDGEIEHEKVKALAIYVERKERR